MPHRFRGDARRRASPCEHERSSSSPSDRRGAASCGGRPVRRRARVGPDDALRRGRDRASTRFAASTSSSSDGTLHGDHGAVGLGQVDPPSHPRRARAPDVAAGSRSPARALDDLSDRELTLLRREPDRLRLPELQPAAGPDRRGEHHAAGDDRRRRASTEEWLETLIDSMGLERPARAPPERDVGRRAAARRRRPRPDHPPGGRLRRRADRQPRLGRGPRDPRACSATRSTSSARRSSWSPTTPAPPRSPTGCSSSPTGRSSRSARACGRRDPRPPQGAAMTARRASQPGGAQAAHRADLDRRPARRRDGRRHLHRDRPDPQRLRGHHGASRSSKIDVVVTPRRRSRRASRRRADDARRVARRRIRGVDGVGAAERRADGLRPAGRRRRAGRDLRRPGAGHRAIGASASTRRTTVEGRDPAGPGEASVLAENAEDNGIAIGDAIGVATAPRREAGDGRRHLRRSARAARRSAARPLVGLHAASSLALVRPARASSPRSA